MFSRHVIIHIACLPNKIYSIFFWFWSVCVRISRKSKWDVFCVDLSDICLSFLFVYDSYFQQLKEPSVVGPFDAIVVHADNSAIKFFSRYGFTDDLILNSRWRYSCVIRSAANNTMHVVQRKHFSKIFRNFLDFTSYFPKIFI